MENTPYAEANLARYVVKKARKDLGLNQKDLEDVNLSASTISNIERGEVDPRDDTFAYLLKKLKLDRMKLGSLIRQEQHAMEELRFYFDCIETMLDIQSFGPTEGKLEILNKLEAVKLEDFHAFAPWLSYLKGRYYYKNKEFKKARSHFEQAIQLCRIHKLEPEDNIISLCYNQLSNCSYHQNDFLSALAHVKNGLEAIDITKKRPDVLHFLLSNKILYLMNSSQSDLALRYLNELWKSLPEIESISTRLNLYKYRSTLLREREEFDAAIQMCREGMELARRNQIQHSHLDLLNILGSIYMKQSLFDKALLRFQMVLEIDRNLEYQRRHIDTHSYLAVLFLSQRDWERAHTHIQEAIQISRKVPVVFRLSKALIIQGNCLSHQKKYADAIPFFRESVELTEKHGFKHRQYSALLKLAHCFDMMKSNNEFINCIQDIYTLQKELNVKSEDDLYEL
ncbi:helix-turn-helix transcriptional regulator [Thermoactinomyces sp. DSM 45892]|uniref:helix-turn-helix domain-containing protein n=1 Tax=Thermoactinomyces sp. DSM 45892 TaxID=1882753 RepID=UPI00089AA925|nr:helix-turn-helix transcriptional regulator [Thermoactinomyces sp. DSM 45892]SDY38574.1 Tetratricopeptide repeat-containing protein [Thermoactinomyces sp. DSM 45892]